jgi:hypothetical protein
MSREDDMAGGVRAFRRPWRRMALWGQLAILVLCCAFACTAFAQRPPLERPRTAEVVVERLPRGYAALEGSTRQPPVLQAAALLSAAAATGDARLATRAESLLPVTGQQSRQLDVLRLRAFAAQHRHAFADAARLLDAVATRAPRDGDTRLSLAQLHLVQGRLDLARRDCATLVLGIDAQDGMLCIASVALRRGDVAQAAAAADRWLARPSTDAATLRYVQVLRGEIAARAGDPAADAWFRQALAIAPGDVRTRSAFARYLRAVGRHRDVIALVGAAPSTETLALQQTLSATALRDPRAAAKTRTLADRFARAHAIGVQPELRDEAEFKLTLQGDPVGALLLAQRNFETQRDFEDVDLLLRTAAAAHRPDALAPLRQWASSQSLPLGPPQ